MAAPVVALKTSPCTAAELTTTTGSAAGRGPSPVAPLPVPLPPPNGGVPAPGAWNGGVPVSPPPPPQARRTMALKGTTTHFSLMVTSNSFEGLNVRQSDQ